MAWAIAWLLATRWTYVVRVRAVFPDWLGAGCRAGGVAFARGQATLAAVGILALVVAIASRLHDRDDDPSHLTRYSTRAAILILVAWCAVFLFYPHKDLGTYAGCGLA